MRSRCVPDRSHTKNNSFHATSLARVGRQLVIMRILVFGGFGFIGRHIVDNLLRAGHDVTAPTRASCDLCRVPAHVLKGILSKAELVVNVVGIKRATHVQSWEAAHVVSVQRLLSEMNERKVTKLIHITVAGLNGRHTDSYSLTKLKSEEEIHSSAAAFPLHAFILRPGVVWGRGDDFSRNLAGGILHAPFFPTPSPSGTLAVVHVHDVAAAVVAAVDALRGSPPDHSEVHVKDVVGPTAYSLAQLQQITAAALGLSCFALPVPAALMVPAAAIVERVMSDPPITTAQLGLLRRGVTGARAPSHEG